MSTDTTVPTPALLTLLPSGKARRNNFENKEEEEEEKLERILPVHRNLPELTDTFSLLPRQLGILIIFFVRS